MQNANNYNKLNLYHNWAGIDLLSNAINSYSEFDVSLKDIDASIIKIIKTLFYIDEISIHVLNSFCSPKHPEHIDDFTKLDWISSFSHNIHHFHNSLHQLLILIVKHKNIYPYENNFPECDDENYAVKFSEEFEKEEFIEAKKGFLLNLDEHYRKHFSILFKCKTESDFKNLYNFIKNSLCNKELISEVTNDFEKDEVKYKYQYIEPFFRGIHQISEIILDNLIDQVNILSEKIKSIEIATNEKGCYIKHNQASLINNLREKMAVYSLIWNKLSDHIYLLSKMDTGSYALYRQSLLGTSGAESVRLRLLHSKILTLCDNLPKEIISKKIFTNALLANADDILLNHLLSSIRMLQAATADFWLKHFSLVMNTIGFIQGSQGLPVSKLLAYATETMMSENSLISVVGDVGKFYANYPEAYIVAIDGKMRPIGKTIYTNIKETHPHYGDYIIPPETGKNYILDNFSLRDLEPNDSNTSPYAKWFDLAKTIDLNTHSFGKPLNIFADSVQKTAERLSHLGNEYWEVFFSERLMQFQAVLFNILHIQDHFTASIDANVTTIIFRLLSAIKKTNPTILTTSQEFLTIKRIIASKRINNNFQVYEVDINENDLNIGEKIANFYQGQKNIDIVMFSQVMSNLQISLSESEIKQIISSIAEQIPIIIDITQGFCNVPINWGKILSKRKNIYLVGSCVKYARSTNGLGFLVYPNGGILTNPADTGWCSYLSGLMMSETTNAKGGLLYDEGLEWFGGTPANNFSLELFINSWDAISRKKETITTMNLYNQTLHKYLLENLGNKLTVVGKLRRELHKDYNSSCLVLQVSPSKIDALLNIAKRSNILFDQRKNCYIRLGFGIHHGKQHVDKLSEILISAIN